MMTVRGRSCDEEAEAEVEIEMEVLGAEREALEKSSSLVTDRTRHFVHTGGFWESAWRAYVRGRRSDRQAGKRIWIEILYIWECARDRRKY